MAFVHLHNHSHYSLLDGLTKIPEMISRIKELGMNAVALTDHGSMYGAIEFYQLANKNNIKPIIGVEAYIAPNRLTDKRPRVDDRPSHLTLLAKTTEGYHNLIKLVSIAHTQGYYYKPRMDMDVLAQYHNGIIALSGCLNGLIPRAILSNQPEAIKRGIQRFVTIFGDDFYFELQPNFAEGKQPVVNNALAELSKTKGVRLVATNDCHYARPEDAESQDILLCIQTKKKKADTDRMSFGDSNCSITSEHDIRAQFPDHQEAIDETARIADACQVEIEFGKSILPHFDTPHPKTAEEYLRDLCEQGLVTRYGRGGATPTVRARLEYELSIITQAGFSSYFLIVQDFVNWAKKNGIVVGPGRGSAAGSLVSYLLNITNLDPLTYNLLFERFLNPERISMPDIDLDFADARRSEVLAYVEERYGKDHVAQIITFGTMAARAAVRDVGRVLGLSYGFCDRIAKMIPMFTSLSEALTSNAELKSVYDSDPDAKTLLDGARKLEGSARHTSTHACGVVITKETLTEYMPIQYAAPDDPTIITQYSLHPIEDLGFLKIDFLGLKNLTIIENAIAIIEKTAGEKIDMDHIPLDDAKTFRLFKRGDTTGVFQLESSGMKRYLRELKPTELEDIIAMVSLYRPGPMELIPDYIAGKHGTKKTTYLHPKLEPILGKTHGIAVYQEQVLQIARDIAGFTLGEADLLRKAIGKKIKELLLEQREKFIRGAIANNVPHVIAEKLWDFTEPFARYGFNRSHAACYAMIAYQTGYLKANYPAQFMAALLTSDQDNTDRIAIEVEECRAMGIDVLPPDINESYSTFTVVKESVEAGKPRIRFGMKAIKNVGSNIVDVIIQERKKNGKYANLEDFLRRVHSKDLNKKSLESLAKSGALSPLAEPNEILYNMDTLLRFAKDVHAAVSSGQANLFQGVAVGSAPRLTLKQVALVHIAQKLSWEKELLGLYISGHPLTEFEEIFKPFPKIRDLREAPKKSDTSIVGIIHAVKRVTTKNGELMIFATVEDATSSIEVIIFPKVYLDEPAVWAEGNVVQVDGRVSTRDNEIKFIASKGTVIDLEKAKQNPPTPVVNNRTKLFQGTSSGEHALRVVIPNDASKNIIQELQQIFTTHPGHHAVQLVIRGKILATKTRTNANPEVVKQLESVVGKNAFQIY
ncbi:MAG: DNA polymerase III subunit alpha [Candidatus Kerfeldbacteria bacterium]|nr:DNA polymerase III subunit alpha [Candidatus Kerfeldbacteria bacterium]